MQGVGLLSDYIDRPTMAKELNCSERTVMRYEQLPDGLPSVTIAGRKLYKVDSARKWIASREHRPNPRRRA